MKKTCGGKTTCPIQNGLLSLALLLCTVPLFSWFQAQVSRPIAIIRSNIISSSIEEGRWAQERWHEYKETVYTSLKSKPPKSDKTVTFLDAPWSNLLEKVQGECNLDKTISDIFRNTTFNNAAALIKDRKYTSLLPGLRRIGVKYVFTPSCGKKDRYEDIEIIPLLFPLPHLTGMVPSPEARKGILYSFVGAQTHPIRQKIAKLLQYDDVIIKIRSEWFRPTEEKELIQQRHEYLDIMSRSRFSLCPRGDVPLTYRITESLYAGAIPVIIADDLTLPPGIDWSECVIQVKEQDIESIDKVIRAICPSREKSMYKACLELACKLKRDQAFFIRTFFEEKSARD